MAERTRDELNELLPWHGTVWGRMQESLRAQRLPHALLLDGRSGLGKNRFAALLARALLCRSPDAKGLPCGICGSCVLARAETHPDLRVCEPETDRKTEKEKGFIGIDQVREVTGFMALKTHFDGYKIVIIRPAEKLNPSAANGLLKTLEEPPAGSLLMLVTAHPATLPATIRSRCQQLLFTAPDMATGTAWLTPRLGAGGDAALLLSLAGGAPLAALELWEQGGGLARRRSMLEDLQAITQGRADPLQIAENWLKFGLKDSLYWLYVWLVDMVRLKVTATPPVFSNPDERSLLLDLSSTMETRRLLRCMEKVLDALRAADGQANSQLLLEDALISWAEIS